MSVVVALAIASFAIALIGDLIASVIFDSRPALLLAMNPRLRYLVNAANELDPLPYATIGFARLVASDPLYYLLGFWYGDRAIAWTARRSRTYGPMIDDGARLFRRAAYPIIFIAPSSIVSTLAAATGIRPATFFGLNLSGTAVRLVLVWYVGGLVEDQVNWLQGRGRRWSLVVVRTVGRRVRLDAVRRVSGRQFRSGPPSLTHRRRLRPGRQRDRSHHQR